MTKKKYAWITKQGNAVCLSLRNTVQRSNVCVINLAVHILQYSTNCEQHLRFTPFNLSRTVAC